MGGLRFTGSLAREGQPERLPQLDLCLPVDRPSPEDGALDQAPVRLGVNVQLDGRHAGPPGLFPESCRLAAQQKNNINSAT
jgi:hypothetical protein